MANKKILTATVLGTFVLLLVLSSSATQAIISSYSINTGQDMKTRPDYFYEEMKIIAGIDNAALIKLHLFGGMSPLHIDSPLFNDVESWAFVISDQQNYAPYLLRRPFKAPDNATLMLEMKGILGQDKSLNESLAIARAFGIHYGLDFHWAGAAATKTGSFLYVFSSGSSDIQIETLVTEIKDDVTNGFASAINPTTVVESPVKAIFIGEDYKGRQTISYRGIYYVDPQAITTANDVYTLSTQNIFGQDLTVYKALGIQRYSVLKFRFPYLINAKSILPRTDNVAPQISGKMDWYMQLPWRPHDVTGNFEVTYTVNNEQFASTPRVSVNMGYNQELLNKDGILEMDYNVTNTGTETANNITISYPLGSDFLDMIKNSPTLPVLRDDVTIDENFTAKVNATLDIDFSGTLVNVTDFHINVEVFEFDGWYRNKTDNSLAFWNESLTEQIVNYEYQSFPTDKWGIPGTGTITVSATLKSDQGLNTILTWLVAYYLSQTNLTNYIITGDFDSLINDYGTALWQGVEMAYLAIIATLYRQQTLFDPNFQDFHIVTRTIGDVGFEHNETFLETTIPSLAPGETVNLKWAIENVTSESMEFGVIRGETINGTDAFRLITEKHNYLEMMQMILGFADDAGQLAYGRPISYYDDIAQAWVSVGARFRYSDPEGFEFFGFSNGINFQLADDEAVLNTHVELNQTSYKVGEPIHISGYIQNTGDIPAYNVKIYLFHGRMGNDWQIRDADLFYAIDVGVIENGTTYNFNVDVDANTFLGIHPVYAVVEFDSDYGEEPLEVHNFWDTNMTAYFEGAAQAHELVLSNMAWALVLPNSNARRPAFPQPVLDIEIESHIIIPNNAPWELEITLSITNVGDAETHITITQFYNQTELELLTKSTTMGGIANGTYFGMGYIRVEGITLYPSDSVTITMHWKFLTSNGCYLPGAEIIYDSRFENELGNDNETGEGSSMAVFNTLDGSSQDANSWNDYGASTSTSSSAGADIFTGGSSKTRRAGSFSLIFFSATALMIPVLLLRKRKRIR